MKVHVLQHASFEGPANIEAWARQRGFTLSKTFLFDQGFKLPAVNSFDLLVIMGGPMGVNEEQKFPWLKAEKKLIAETIAAKKKIVGICLGAQLVAQALGANVFPQKHKEIGWFPVETLNAVPPISEAIPSPHLVFHWHGDTFDLPPGAHRFARSPVCENQAFLWSDLVLGLQFHLEVQPDNVRDFVVHGRKELVEGGPFVQRAETIIAESSKALSLRPVLDRILDSFVNGNGNGSGNGHQKDKP
jgi:GMP synthase-like glutamine amidotransferase